MSMLLSSEKPFVKYMNNWAEEYRNRTIKDNYQFFAKAMGIKVSQPLTKANTRLLEKRLDGQILVMKYYATTRMMLTATKANFVNTKRFLARQNYWIAPKRPEYGLFFTLYNGSRVFLYTDDLEDIDYADLHAGSGFYDITITKQSWEEVPEEFPAEFLARLRWDLEYDGFEVGFSVDEENGSYVDEDKSGLFQVSCNIEGDLGMDKVVKIMKCNKLFKVDVLKCIMSKQSGGPKFTFKAED